MTDKKEKKGKEISKSICKNFNNSNNYSDKNAQPQIGNKVLIIIKPYSNYICKSGIVKDVLTKSRQHSRGYKVRLTTGIIGRTMKIF